MRSFLTPLLTGLALLFGASPASVAVVDPATITLPLSAIGQTAD